MSNMVHATSWTYITERFIALLEFREERCTQSSYVHFYPLLPIHRSLRILGMSLINTKSSVIGQEEGRSITDAATFEGTESRAFSVGAPAAIFLEHNKPVRCKLNG